MAKTNVRDPNDQRPAALPRGIHPIPHRRFKRRPSRTRARQSAPDLYLRYQADLRVAARLAHIRDHRGDYEANYPAAVEVRDKLGLAQWEKLERLRDGIVRVSVYMRKLDREQLTVPKERLDVDMPTMKQYIKRVRGDRCLEFFECIHESMSSVVKDLRRDGPMVVIRDLFHRRPILWFVYNLYFPTKRPGVSREGRMKWHEQMEWAIWTLEHCDQEQCFVEEPSAPPSTNNIIWNQATVEVFQKIRRAFRPQK